MKNVLSMVIDETFKTEDPYQYEFNIVDSKFFEITSVDLKVKVYISSNFDGTKNINIEFSKFDEQGNADIGSEFILMMDKINSGESDEVMWISDIDITKGQRDMLNVLLNVFGGVHKDGIYKINSEIRVPIFI